MLIKISRAVLLLIIVYVASVILPDFYWKLFQKSSSPPYLFYSSIKKDFLYQQRINKKNVRFDCSGDVISYDEFAKLTPMYSFRFLKYKDLLPDTINGWETDIDQLKLNNVNIKIRPDAIYLPAIKIFPLMESKPDGPKLFMPEEYSRIDSRIDFINCETNEIDEDLSNIFTSAMKKEGFTFPAVNYFGTPSTLKAFDEGYFIEDSENQLFHIKRVNNQPFCRKLDLPAHVEIAYIQVTEIPLREFYGVLVSKSNEVYFISYDNYKLVKAPIKNYDHTKMELIIKGNIFYRIFSVIADDKIEAFVTDRNYELLDTFKKEWDTKYETSVGSVFNFLFPFSIEMIDENSGFVDFNFYTSGFAALPLIFISLLLLMALRHFRNEKIGDCPFDYIVILFTGIFGLIAIAMIRIEK